MMKSPHNITNLSLNVMSLILGLLLTTGCTTNDLEVTSQGTTIMVGVEPVLSLSCNTSRDNEETIEAVTPETIGVFGYIKEPEEPVFGAAGSLEKSQKMYYKNGMEIKSPTCEVSADNWPTTNDWPYTPTKNWIEGKTYRFYAYTPYSDKAEVFPSNYNFSQFTLIDIPPISSTPYGVAEASWETTWISASPSHPQFKLLHLTSRLRFCFAVGEKYYENRDIRVKSITISDAPTGSHYYNCKVDLTTSPLTISIEESTNTYVNEGTVTLNMETPSADGIAGMLLSTDYKPFSSAYNMLKTIDFTTLTVVYDVYDKKGIRTRVDQTTSNIVDLRPLGSFSRGYCYDVKILITPKYLYVLSDNDVMPDGIIEPAS